MLANCKDYLLPGSVLKYICCLHFDPEAVTHYRLPMDAVPIFFNNLNKICKNTYFRENKTDFDCPENEAKYCNQNLEDIVITSIVSF